MMFEFPFRILLAEANEDGTYSAVIGCNVYDKKGREYIANIPRCKISIDMMSDGQEEEYPYNITLMEQEQEQEEGEEA